MNSLNSELTRVGAPANVLRRALITLALLTSATACVVPQAEVEEPGIEAVVVTQWNDSTELFLEYPHPVAGEQTGNWAIHLTDMGDFQPIRTGTLTVRFVAASGVTAQSFLLEVPARDGIFLLDPVVTDPGVYEVRLELSSPQVTSVHILPSVRVFASMDEAPLESGEEEMGGAIAFLKEQQWVIPFAVSPAVEQEVQRSVRAPAEIVPPDGALVLRSPITGVVARREFVPGGRVTAGVPLFTVVDPSTAWLRVQLPVGRIGSMDRTIARFTVEGAEDLHETLRLMSVGTVVDPRTRTVPVVYEEVGAAGGFMFGQLADAAVPLDAVERGAAIPETAVLDDNGTPVAYVQVGGEEFARRALTLGPSDGEHVIVRAGIELGEMVVVIGAYQVRLASLSGNEFAGGHAH